MLKDRIEALERKGNGDAKLLDAARNLLTTGVERVTGCMTSAEEIKWQQPKDRSVADAVRREVLDMLVSLQAQ